MSYQFAKSVFVGGALALCLGLPGHAMVATSDRLDGLDTSAPVQRASVDLDQMYAQQATRGRAPRLVPRPSEPRQTASATRRIKPSVRWSTGEFR